MTRTPSLASVLALTTGRPTVAKFPFRRGESYEASRAISRRSAAQGEDGHEGKHMHCAGTRKLSVSVPSESAVEADQTFSLKPRGAGAASSRWRRTTNNDD
jgi:hypothetical protein